MVKSNVLAWSPEAYSPHAYNRDAFNMVVYSRPQSHAELMFFPRKPKSGLLTLEDIMDSGGAREMSGGAGIAPRSQDRKFTAEAMIAEPDGDPGAVVPFLESCYPMAVMFNTSTGVWTSAQARSAAAAADRTNVFRALEGLPDQVEVPVVVESPTALGKALEKVAANTGKALVQSSVAPMCTDMRVVDADQSRSSYPAIFEAATKTSIGPSLIVAPFLGQKDAKPEFCFDGIFVDSEFLFCATSEKARVSSEPPYEDRRIVTTDEISDGVRAAALKVVAQVAERLGIRQCVFHAEFWITDNGPQLSDFMTRPGGGFIPEMVKEKWGVDLRAAHVYASFGMVNDLANVAKMARPRKAQVAIGSIGTNSDPINATMTDASRAALAANKSVVAYSFVNEFSNSAVGNNDCRGALCVTGPTTNDAVDTLDKIAAKFNLS